MRAGNGEGNRRRTEFEQVALPLASSLRSVARRLTGRREAADDLVQETFLRAYRTFDNFVPGTNARAWLFTILYSIHANARQRQHTAAGTMSIEEMEERFERTVEIADDAALRCILENPRLAWEGSAAEQALAALPEPFRTAVVLVDLEDMTYEEAAGVAGCPVGTLRSRLFRARKALAVALADWARQRPVPKPGSR
jgi:RNA polymerase sigma-70 factor (ECF subfamily)